MESVQTNRSTVQSWINGPGDLKQDTVEDVPVPGESVLVRGLPAAYSNEATSEALELKTIGDQQIATVNTAKMEVLQFAHGCVDPQFSVEQARLISEKYGPAFKKVVNKIDELSGVNKEAYEEAKARFPVVDAGAAAESPELANGAGNGSASGSGRPDVPARAGAGDGQERA